MDAGTPSSCGVSGPRGKRRPLARSAFAFSLCCAAQARPLELLKKKEGARSPSPSVPLEMDVFAARPVPLFFGLRLANFARATLKQSPFLNRHMANPSPSLHVAVRGHQRLLQVQNVFPWRFVSKTGAVANRAGFGKTGFRFFRVVTVFLFPFRVVEQFPNGWSDRMP